MLDNAGEEIAADKSKGCSIERDEAPVGQDHSPTAHKSVSFAYRYFSVDKFASAKRVVLDKIAVADGDHYDQQGSDEHTHSCSGRSCLWKKCCAGKHEAAPSDDGAESKAPDIHRSHYLAKFCTLFRHLSRSRLELFD